MCVSLVSKEVSSLFRVSEIWDTRMDLILRWTKFKRCSYEYCYSYEDAPHAVA